MGLMGENGAGKSTMMKCLFGTYQKDEGNIYLDGKEVNFSGPKDALENGIAMVHQELNQCLERNVVDNLFLGRYPVNSLGVIDEKRMKNEASKLFRKLGMTVNLDQPMRNMSVSQRQMCEIDVYKRQHVNHVATQLPYVGLVAAVCMIGYFIIGVLQAVGLTQFSLLALPVCIVLLVAVLFVIRAKTGGKEEI